MSVILFPRHRTRKPGTGKTPPRLEQQVLIFKIHSTPSKTPQDTLADRSTLHSTQPKSQIKQPLKTRPLILEDFGQPNVFQRYPSVTAQINHRNRQAPITTLDERSARKLIFDLIALLNKNEHPQRVALALVRLIGTNTHDPKLLAGTPALYFHLRLLTTIYTMNDTRYPLRLIDRLKDTLKERQTV